MKKIILIFLIFFVFSDSYSQNYGTQLIYNSGNFGIVWYNSIKPNNSGIKNLYIQLGLFNIQGGTNESGRYLKLNKNTGNWYIPHNGFLNANWGLSIPSMIYDCEPIPFFAISYFDTGQIIKFSITAAVECPDAKTIYTKNGGLNYLYTSFNCGGIMLFPYGGDYNPKRNSTMLYGYGNSTFYEGSAIYISTNSGDNWTLLTPRDSLRISAGCISWAGSYRYGFLKYNPFDTSFVYANGLTSLYLSTNGGYNFFKKNVSWMKDIIFSYKDSVIYGFNRFRLYRSSNKGVSWDSVISDINFSSLEVNPDLPNILYAGDSLGIYRSTNYGTNWLLYNNSFTPSKIIIGVSKDAGSLDTFYAVTTKSVYKVWASYLVGLKNVNYIIPEKYYLFQNYPNPFNPVTKIKFDIPSNLSFQSASGGESGFVLLKVFDITGHEIRALVNEKLNPGTYEVTFDASNLPSGIYFYVLKTEDYIESKKMVLIK